jgi:small subunit ribosomal protein S6
MSDSRQYELLYVVSPVVTEDGVTELHARIEEIVQQLGGSIEKTDNWGRRRLAYEIDRHRDGTYVLELLNAPGSILSELDRRLRVMDELLRHLIVRVDEDLRKAAHLKARREAKNPITKSVGSASDPTAVQPSGEASDVPSVSAVEAPASTTEVNE